jgi:hypothetical protein
MATSFEHFFAGDAKAGLYVNANYAGDDYKSCQFDQVSKLENSVMAELMRAGNYKDFQNNKGQLSDGQGNILGVVNPATGRQEPVSQGPDDVHQDVTDFLVTAALYHNVLDEMRYTGAAAVGMREMIQEHLRTDSGILFAVAPRGPHGSVKDAIAAGAVLNGVTILENIAREAARLIDVGGAVANAVVANDEVFGDCAQDDEICGLLFSGNVANMLRLLTGHNGLQARAQFQAEMNAALTPVIQSMIDDRVARGAPITPVADRYQPQIEAAIMRGFDTVYRTLRTMEAAPIAADYQAQSLHTSQVARDFFNRVFKKSEYEKLSVAAGRFYRDNVSVLATTGSRFINKDVQNRETSSDTAYIRLTLDEILAIDNPDTDELRLNINKGTDAMDELRFRTCIPVINASAGNSRRVWVTINASLECVETQNEKFLQEVYEAAYDNADDQLGGRLNGHIERDLAKRSKADYNLNWGLFLKNVQDALDRAAGDAADCQDEVITVDDCADDLPDFTDFAYGKVWQWDAANKTYFRYVNGNKRTYADDINDDKNCYQSYLAGKVPEAQRNAKCVSVLQCLADGDPSSLNACINLLRDSNLWDVAQQDVQNVSPYVVKTVLKKFNVQASVQTDDNGKKYKMPMTYDQWETYKLKTMDAETQKAINENANLKTYLKGLLSVCRANPVIINKFEPAIGSEGLGQTISEYVNRLSKNRYVDPRDADSDYAVAAAQLRALPHGTLMPTMFSSKLGSLHNASFYSNQRPQLAFGGAYNMGQTGGDLYGVGNRFMVTSGTRLEGKNLTLKDGSGNIFEGLFNAIQKGLSDMGVAMDPTDAKRIAAAISKLQEIENKLIQIVRRLSIAVRMGETFGAHNYVTDRDTVSLMKPNFDSVKDNKSAREFMEGHSKQLRDAYEALHGHYSNISSDLATHIYPRYLDRCCEPKKADAPAPGEPKWVGLSEDC